MAIEFPLNSDAVSAADDRFYELYPEMIDENGNRIPLSATNDPNNDMHEMWVQLYNEELAAREGGGEDGEDDESEDDEDDEDEDEEDDGSETIPPEEEEEFPTEPPDPCEECEKSWISLDLTYADNEDCEGIQYSALLTDSYQRPVTGTEPQRWDDIPAGNCLFGEFEFHKDGESAVKPNF